jgi:cytoskeletal protein CcmA (bactofilin family)
MVFRKESKVDAFQRQISALRQQLGDSHESADDEDYDDSPASRNEANRTATAEPVQPDQADSGFNFGGFNAQPVVNETQMAAEVQSSPISELPAVNAQTSVVAHDTTWKGDLESDGSVHVHGRVEGSIRAKLDIFIAEEADVDATVTATNVVIAGLIQGSIRCSNRFEVLPQGRVSGDINAPTLVIHEGAHVTGQFRMESGEHSASNKPTSVVQRRAARGSA